MKFKYAETMTGNAPLGGIVSTHFSVNGLWDPNTGGIGHQPYGFDQMMQFFDHYTVTKCTIVFSGISNQTIPLGVFVALRDSTTLGSSTTDNVCEEPGIKHRWVGHDGDDKWRIAMHCDVGKFFNKRALVGAADYRGDETTNPAEQAYWHVGFMSNNATDDLSLQVGHVELYYTAVLTEPKNLPTS